MEADADNDLVNFVDTMPVEDEVPTDDAPPAVTDENPAETDRVTPEEAMNVALEFTLRSGLVGSS